MLELFLLTIFSRKVPRTAKLDQQRKVERIQDTINQNCIEIKR